MKSLNFKRFVLPLFLAVVLAVYCIPVIPAAADDAINVNGNFIFGLSAYKRVADVKVIAGSDASVKDKDGNVLLVTEAKYVGTNFKLKRNADDDYRIIVVKGDINGDGALTVTDYLMIKRHVASTYVITGAYKYAADIDDDGNINLNDYTTVKLHLKNKADMYATPSTGPDEIPVDVTDPASNPGTIKFNGTTVEVTGENVYANGSTAVVTGVGDFTVTGSTTNGYIHVMAGAEDKVKLRLSGVSITNTSGPAIDFEQCKKALVTITADTVNTLVDGSTYSTSSAKSALFSNDTLEIKGSGTLSVTANYKHGICSDDDVVIENGNITIVSSATDAIHANDEVAISGGNVTIKSSAKDGIESEGFVNISGGAVSIACSGDGIKAATTANISGGVIEIKADQDGLKAGNSVDLTQGDINITGGVLDITSKLDGIQADANLYINNTYAGMSDETVTPEVAKCTLSLNGVNGSVATSGGAYVWTTGSISNTATYWNVIAAVGSGNKYEVTAVYPSGSAKTISVPANGILLLFHQDATSFTDSSAVAVGDKITLNNVNLTAGTVSSGATAAITTGGASLLDPVNLSVKAGGGVAGAASLTTTSDSCKGLKAATSLTIDACTMSIDSAEDSIHSNATVVINGGTIITASGRDGVSANTTMNITGGSLVVSTSTGSSGTASTDISYKGIKSTGDMTITGGTFTVTTSDDCVHTNGNLTISGGTFKLSSGDDGVHSDALMKLSGTADITITKSYEGLEALKVEISGGKYVINSTDDGINAAGGNDGSGSIVPGTRPGRPGAPGSGTATSGNYYINISGGYVDITISPNGDHDGIDSNGTYTQTGGIVITRGPNQSMSAALDADGTRTVSGGTLIALGYASVTRGTGVSSYSLSLHSQGTHTIKINGVSYTITNSSSYGRTVCYSSVSVTNG